MYKITFMACILYTDKLAFLYNRAIEIQIRFSNNFKNEMSTCKANKQLQMHVAILPCGYNRGKCSKNETCAKLHRFHILHISCGSSHFTDGHIKARDVKHQPARSKRRTVSRTTENTACVSYLL